MRNDGEKSDMKHTILGFALFVHCWFSVAVAQTWPPKLSPTDADNQVAVAIRDADAAKTVRDSVPICGMIECYSAYLSQKRQIISALEEEVGLLATAAEQRDLLAENYWFENAQYRVASNRMCMIGGDLGCVLYANNLFTALQQSSRIELNAPSKNYLAAELDALTDKACHIRTDHCLVETVIEYLDAACERSSGEACLSLAEKWGMVDMLGLEMSRTYAETMTRACNLDTASACWSIVESNMRRESIWTEETWGLAYKACQLGSLDACVTIARSVKHGTGGITANVDGAKTLLTNTYCAVGQLSEAECNTAFAAL